MVKRVYPTDADRVSHGGPRAGTDTTFRNVIAATTTMCGALDDANALSSVNLR